MASKYDWKIINSGRTNGVNHALHNFCYRGDICPTIFEADNVVGVTLVINGYQFKCESVDAAKIEAEERLENNRGIYLPWIPN